MTRELPGLYYDPEKNRYFPIKGTIRGGSIVPAIRPSSKPCHVHGTFRLKGAITMKLLQYREICGNGTLPIKGKLRFPDEYQKKLASQPIIWKYGSTEKFGDAALEKVRASNMSCGGQYEFDLLLTGNTNGCLSFLLVGDIAEYAQNVTKLYPDRVQSSATEIFDQSMESPLEMWQASGSLQLSSSISCIQASDISFPHHVLITTMGSGASLAHVDILNLSGPLNPRMDTFSISQELKTVGLFKFTIWTANCDFFRHRATLGTNKGAALVNLENGLLTWVYRSRSDVLSQQLYQSRNVILCGLRNGAIVSVDVRRKPRHLSEFKGGSGLPEIASMPSSVCSLKCLELYDGYFMAASMDGSVMLYDLRKMKMGGVQSYDGHMNSHTPLPLCVDPSERFLIAGGEDCAVRVWSLKSGELLFEDKFSDSVISSLCCLPYEGKGELKHGAWLGSRSGLFRLNWF